MIRVGKGEIYYSPNGGSSNSQLKEVRTDLIRAIAKETNHAPYITRLITPPEGGAIILRAVLEKIAPPGCEAKVDCSFEDVELEETTLEDILYIEAQIKGPLLDVEGIVYGYSCTGRQLVRRFLEYSITKCHIPVPFAARIVVPNTFNDCTANPNIALTDTLNDCAKKLGIRNRVTISEMAYSASEGTIITTITH